jgi:hypothetical protein
VGAQEGGRTTEVETPKSPTASSRNAAAEETKTGRKYEAEVINKAQ